MAKKDDVIRPGNTYHKKIADFMIQWQYALQKNNTAGLKYHDIKGTVESAP